MSKIAFQSQEDGTGTFTIAAPVGNTNRTLTIPDSSGTLITTAGAAMSGPLSNFTSTGIVDNATATSLTIDSAGRVLMPSQPIISGQMGAAMTSPSGAQVLAFDQFWVNRGNISYNSSTKRFTVPAAGIYRITFNPFFNTGIGNARVLIGVNTDTPSANNGHFGHTYRESSTYDTGCINSIVSLASGDYIVFYLAAGSLYNQSTDRFNQFSIVMIA